MILSLVFRKLLKTIKKPNPLAPIEWKSFCFSPFSAKTKDCNESGKDLDKNAQACCCKLI
jgi:hypothetical protein